MFLQMDAFFDRFYSYKSSRFLKNLFLINTCPLDVRVSSCSRCKVSLREHSGCYPGSIQAFWGTISRYYPRAIWIQSGDIQTLDSKLQRKRVLSGGIRGYYFSVEIYYPTRSFVIWILSRLLHRLWIQVSDSQNVSLWFRDSFRCSETYLCTRAFIATITVGLRSVIMKMF